MPSVFVLKKTVTKITVFFVLVACNFFVTHCECCLRRRCIDYQKAQGILIAKILFRFFTYAVVDGEELAVGLYQRFVYLGGGR